MSFLESAIWIYASIQSPFLIACSYGLIDRFKWIASPYVVAPSIGGICLGFFLFGPAGTGGGYVHFLYAGGFMLSVYFLTLRFGYSRPQALLFAVLTEIAIDELWQMPYNLMIWPQSLLNFEVGITTAGWNLMALPLVGYFLLRFNGRMRLDGYGKGVLLVASALTVYGTIRVGLSMVGGSFVGGYYIGPPYFFTDWLLFPWFLFFLLLFRSSKRASIYTEP